MLLLNVNMRLRCITILFFVLMAGLPFSYQVYCQDQAKNNDVKMLNGKVIAVDSVSAKITIRYYDPGRYSYDEMAMTVSEDAKITRGKQVITLSQIQEGDRVDIEYRKEALSGLVAKSINDQNLANK